MTVAEILEQAKKLTPEERDELVEQLTTLDEMEDDAQHASTGAEIVAMIEALEEPIELVDPHIEDPVEWVKAQRRKRKEQLKEYAGN